MTDPTVLTRQWILENSEAVLEPGRRFKARVIRFRWKDRSWLLKDISGMNAAFRCVFGRRMLRRESRAYRALEGVEGVPHSPGMVGRDGLVVEFVDGVPLGRLTIPEDTTESVLTGEQVKILFEREGAGPSSVHDQFRISRATYTLLADLIVATEQDGSISAESIGRVNSAPRMLTMDVQPAGQRKEIPTGFTQAVPGTMVMFTLIVLLTSGSVLLVVERRDGLLRRLASTPVSRSSVVWGKWGGRVALGWTQLAFAMLVGKFLFKTDWGPHLGFVILLLAVYAGLIAWFAILLGTLARTEGQAVGMGVLLSNVLAALGGCWWPIEVTPDWMQQLANFLPTGWAMDAMHKIVIFGNRPSTIVPQLVTMVVVALIAAWISAKKFRFE